MTFDMGTGANGTVYCAAVQPDGKILIGGNFIAYNGTTRNRIARLNADGSLDTGFDPGTGANSSVHALIVQPDGKVLIGGYFVSFNGTAKNYFARLNADGSLDTGFNPIPNSPVLAIALQANGRIIIGGTFTTVTGATRNHIARLSAFGSLDATFDPGSGTDQSVNTIAYQPDGKILIGGLFYNYAGTARTSVARLTATGGLDNSFDPGTALNGWVGSTLLQPDGRVIIGGPFTSYNGIARNRIARLNPDGGLDDSFEPGTGANSTMYCMAQRPDGTIIIGGDFTTYEGTGRNHLASIRGTARANVKLMLEGPYNGSAMNDALRTLPSFPLTEPFTAMGYSQPAYIPGATIPAGVLSVTGNNAIVDWMLVEMRPAATPSVVAASRAVLLQRDGDVVELDGVSTVGFAGLSPGSYCVAVRPRNHLPVMLSPSTPIVCGDAIASVDFTLPGTQIYDHDARTNIAGTMVLAAGDVTFDGTVKYAGSTNDRDPILARIGGTVPTATVSGYWREDVNMDGVVKYAGSSNDRDRVLNSIGGSVPTAMRVATLP